MRLRMTLRSGTAPAAGDQQRGSRARAGFTIVEMIVAIMVLSIGVLGLASTAAVVQRQMASGERQSVAATIAQSRFDELTSRNCDAVSGTSGAASHRNGQILERWNVIDGDKVKQITDTIRITGRVNPLVYTTYVPCRN
jgi:prepilin-type N-terminal cleavage/methylation domain-containing protein